MPRRWRPVFHSILPLLLVACGGGTRPLPTLEPIPGSRTREGGEIVPIDSTRIIRRSAEGNPVGEIVPLQRGAGGEADAPVAGEIRRLGDSTTGPSRTIVPLGAPSGPADTLLGTTWNGRGLDGEITFEFLADGVLRYTTDDQTYDNGTWRQTGNVVSFEMNARFAEWSGRIGASRMSGTAHNRAGREWNWQADRR